MNKRMVFTSIFLSLLFLIYCFYWVTKNSKEPKGEDLGFVDYRKLDDSVKDKNVSADRRLKKAVTISQKQIRSINFHGKVVDQNSDPVPGVLVEFDADGNYLAAGSGVGRVVTDGNGLFSIDHAYGSSLSLLKFVKNGYDFSFVDGNKRNFNFDVENVPGGSPDKRYTFKMWKVGEYPKIATGDYVLGFTPDERVSTLNFFSETADVLSPGLHVDGDIAVSFSRDGTSWSVKIYAIDGGVQEARGGYQNVIPIDGFDKEVSYSYEKSEAKRINKVIYFVSRGRGAYGKVDMEIMPYYSDKSAISLHYVVNLEGKRSVVQRK